MERIRRVIGRLRVLWIDFIQNSVAGAYIVPQKMRIILLNLCGNKISYDCVIYPKAFCGWGKGKLQIDTGSFVNYNVFFDLGEDIIIGKNVFIAMNVHFINSTHVIGDKKKRASDSITKKIVVHDGVWIGADCTIMPGVTIQEGTVIGAGSLVLSDCEPNAIYAGCPAKLIKRIED